MTIKLYRKKNEIKRQENTLTNPKHRELFLILVQIQIFIAEHTLTH